MVRATAPLRHELSKSLVFRVSKGEGNAPPGSYSMPNSRVQADWRHHKAICQTIQLVEKDTETTSDMAAAYPQAAQNDLETLDRISVAHADRMVGLCEKLLQR